MRHSVSLFLGRLAALCAVAAAAWGPRPALGEDEREDANLRRGRILYKSGKYNEAIAELNIALRRNPRNGEAHLYLGKSHARISEFDKAVDALQQAVQIVPNSEDALSELSGSYLELDQRERGRGNLEQAREFLEKAESAAKTLEQRQPKAKESFELLARLAKHKADVYRDSGEPDKERDMYDQVLLYCSKVLEIDPNDVSTRLDEIRTLFGLRRFKDAERRCNELLKINPQLHEPKLIIAAIRRADGDNEGAVKVLTEVLTEKKTQIEAMLRRAEIYLDLQKYEEALADANEAIRLTNKNPYANFIRGCVYMQLKKLDAAIQELQFAASGMPKHLPSHFWLARCLLMKDRLRDAIEELNTVVKLDARFTTARLVLASAHLQNGYPDGAITTLVDALHFDSRNIEVYRLLGIAYLHKGENERAEQQFAKMLDIDPGAARAHQVLAGIKLAKGKVDEAIDHCRTALEVEPKNVDVHFLLGLAYMRRGRFDGAKAQFENVLSLREKHPGARMNLAAVHVQLRELDLAQEQLQRCIEEDPTQTKPRYSLAKLYLAQRKFDKAEAELTQLLKNESERANVHLAMAELHLAKGEKERAVEAAKAALSLNAKALDARVFLARLYIADQNWAGALAEFETALKEDPKLAAAYEAAIIQVYLGRYEEAVKLFEKAVQNDIAPPSSLAGAAAALQLRGDHRAALASISQADAQKPQDPLIALQTLNIYLGQGDVTNARTLLRQATYLPEVIRDAYVSFLENFAEDKARSRAVSDALTRIIFYGAHGWHDQAEENCNLLVKLAPDNTFAYTVLANVYLATGRPEKEIATLRKLVDVAQKDYRHRVRLGKRLIEIGQFQEARKQFELAAEIDPKAVEPVLQLGAYFLRTTQVDLATQQAHRALKIEENNPRALALLASCQLAEKKLEEARATLSRIAESKAVPKGDLPYLQLAELDLLDGKTDRAISRYREAVAASPKSIPAHMGLGEALRLKGNLREAIEHFREALAIDATYSPALLALSRAYRDTNRLDLALEYCEQAAEVNPSDVDVRFEIAAIRFIQKKYDEAIAEYTRMLKDRPNDYRARIGIAQSLFEAGQRQPAIDQLTDLIKQSPDLAPARASLIAFYKRLGEIDKAQVELEILVRAAGPTAPGALDLAALYVHKDNLDTALDIADRALQARENDLMFLVLRGTVLQLKGRLIDAVETFQTALRLAPKNARLSSLFANACLAAGKPAEARKALDEAELGPDVQAAYRKLADTLSAGGDAARLTANALNQAALYADANWLTLARDAYNRLLKDLPNNLAVLHLLASIYERMGDSPKCIETYQRMVQAAPDYEPALLRLASHHIQGNNLEAAASIFRTLLNRKRDDVGLQLSLATVLQRQKKVPEAIELYKRILKQDGNNPIALNNLAWLYAVETKDLKAAEELATKAANLTDLDSAAGAAIRDTLGWVFYITERYDKALELARQAADGMPGSAEVHYHLGMIYFKRNLRASAARHLLLALRLDPDLPEKAEVEKILERIRQRQP
ncbi:MAG TPA: tetratricopeptide repeat protein [Planctomycetota bacterium]|nr:tetratricopeptide repeat protein [Planctomycetota bacterium]HRT94603.1 tetratricopeptide repeat protein [Planctomycetota bacterium]